MSDITAVTHSRQFTVELQLCYKVFELNYWGAGDEIKAIIHFVLEERNSAFSLWWYSTTSLRICTPISSVDWKRK